MELSELIESVDIVDYISQFVDLEEKNGEFWSLSPFKDEKTPSFSVRRETHSFYDFSSGIGGNVFTFIKYYNHCTAKDAIEILRKYAGVDGNIGSNRQKFSATMSCKKFMHKKQPKKQHQASSLPDHCMEKYEKNDSKLAVWEREGISRASLDKFQVYYDAFSDRLVYPIRNMDGKIVNIGGRTLDPDWKEKKLRKYTYFSSWGELDVLYGLYENMKYITDADEVIIFEGCKSVLIADSWGIHNTAALLTSHLNPNQMKLLAKLGAHVVFALDKDVRVRDDHNINKLKRYVNVEYIWDYEDLLDEKDSPVDKGLEVFQKLYDRRIKLK